MMKIKNDRIRKVGECYKLNVNGRDRNRPKQWLGPPM